MKVVITTIFILIITFLSERIDISIEKGQRFSIILSLMLVSVTLFPSDRKKRGGNTKLGNIKPILGAIRFLFRQSRVHYEYTRGLTRDNTLLSILSAPISSLAIASILAALSDGFAYSESADLTSSTDIHRVTLSTHVIFLPISLTLFIYLRLKYALRKRLRNVG